VARKITLSAINNELRLATQGITIRVDGDKPDTSGRLRIGKAKIIWTPKFKQIPREKTWDELIVFLNKP
jgi:hypothetical protein